MTAPAKRQLVYHWRPQIDSRRPRAASGAAPSARSLTMPGFVRTASVFVIVATLVAVDWKLSTYPLRGMTLAVSAATAMWPIAVLVALRKLRVSSVALMALCPIVVATCQSVFGAAIYAETQRDVHLHFARIAGWCLIGYNLRPGRREPWQWCEGIAWAMAAMCVYGYVAIAVLGYPAARVENPMGSPEPVGYLSLPAWGALPALMFAFAWFLSYSIVRPRVVSIQTLLLIVSAYNLWSLSKQGAFCTLVCIGFAGVVCAARSVRRGIHPRRLASALFAIGLLTLIALQLSAMVARGEPSGRIGRYLANHFFHMSSMSDVASTEGSRVWNLWGTGRFDQIWPVALERFRYSPLVGNGFDQRYGIIEQAHNGFLDVLVGVGLLGAVPLALGGGLALWRGVRVFIRTADESTRILALGCLCFAVSYLAANLGDTQRLYTVAAALYGLCLGVLLRLYAYEALRDDRARREPGRRRRRIPVQR